QQQAGLEARGLGAGGDRVVEDVLVPPRREAVPHRHRRAVVEREDDQHEDRGPQEQVDEEGAEPQAEGPEAPHEEVAAQAPRVDAGGVAALRPGRRRGHERSSSCPQRVYTSTPTNTSANRTIETALPSGMF